VIQAVRRERILRFLLVSRLRCCEVIALQNSQVLVESFPAGMVILYYRSKGGHDDRKGTLG
jgi:hypothetical protein